MNILRSNDVKRINKIVIRNALLQLRTATRKEIMETTGFSSSSIGSLIAEMIKKNDILELSIDSSTGGRCPMRYALNHELYRVMCILIDREFANVTILDSLAQEVYCEKMEMADLENLVEKIADDCEGYGVKSIHVSIPGIILDDIVLQDSKDGMKEIDIFKRLKEITQLPVFLENDVKSMVQGYYADHELEDQNISYLYLSKEGGLGCASVSEGIIIQGSNHLAGEIGLLEYGGQSMNNLLRQHPNDEDTILILSRLVSVLVCCVNPSLIVLSGVKESYKDAIIQQVEAIVSNRFSLHLSFDDKNEYYIFKALWTKAMDTLLHN